MKYIQTNELQAQINWEAIMPMSRYAGGHDEQMKALFKGSKVLGHWNEGDYQGQVATCVQLADGRVAVYNDYYGSCSGCDSWEDATDADVRKLCIDLSNSAYVFATLEDAMAWMENEAKGDKSEWCRWNECAVHLLDAVRRGDVGYSDPA